MRSTFGTVTIGALMLVGVDVGVGILVEVVIVDTGAWVNLLIGGSEYMLGFGAMAHCPVNIWTSINMRIV